MTRSPLPLAFGLVLFAACSRDAPPPPAATSAVATAQGSAAADLLDRIDTRAPVPLLPMMANHQKENMRDHLVAVQEIVAALAADDFSGIALAAGRIGRAPVKPRVLATRWAPSRKPAPSVTAVNSSFAANACVGRPGSESERTMVGTPKPR